MFFQRLPYITIKAVHCSTCPLPSALSSLTFALCPYSLSSASSIQSPTEQVRRTDTLWAKSPLNRQSRNKTRNKTEPSWWRSHCTMTNEVRRWWKVPPGLFLTFCLLLLIPLYKKNERNLALQSFFCSPLFSFTLESSPSETWKSCRCSGALLDTKSSCIKSLFYTLTITHTFSLSLHLLFFLSFAFAWKREKKKSWEFRGCLPVLLPPFQAGFLKSINLKVQ